MGQVIETDEQGRLVLPPEILKEILGDAQPHSRYKVQPLGSKLVVEPEVTEAERQQAVEDWERQWKIVQEQVSKVWPAGVSAIDVISEMRR